MDGEFGIWHVGSQFPDQGLNLSSLQWKLGVLTTGLPGKSLCRFSDPIINKGRNLSEANDAIK